MDARVRVEALVDREPLFGEPGQLVQDVRLFVIHRRVPGPGLLLPRGPRLPVALGPPRALLVVPRALAKVLGLLGLKLGLGRRLLLGVHKRREVRIHLLLGPKRCVGLWAPHRGALGLWGCNLNLIHKRLLILIQLHNLDGIALKNNVVHWSFMRKVWVPFNAGTLKKISRTCINEKV